MFQAKFVEKISKYILCSTIFFPKKPVFYEVMWKNVVEGGSPQMAIWCMCAACWIPKATNTHSEYVMLIVLPIQQWSHECASPYTYIVWPATFT
jgi:hypothetical protein